ncbi:efflux transporter outer membrane subunit [uncultured Stenotrophomonas sp.]|uniref:efflux transporter outer membrane subunit n=1 Tax=uncultured Stenotrophomonas sp. TaxID=165438 RepID=UPI0028E4C19A|nr:efflux transporter outer membrane subunit [uncultured Stenotrophomonas sp.]
MHKRVLGRAAAVLVACQLCACNLAPTYERPDAPVPATFPPSAAEGRAAPSIPWQTYFHDPVLRDLIGQSLAYNRDLAGAAARIEQARAQFRIQRSQRLPGLDASASGQRQRGPLSPADNAPRVTLESYGVQVGIPSFELDFWGRVANLSEVARRQYLATVEARNIAELSLVANVAASYYAVRASQEGIVLAERSLTSRNETLELAQLRMDAGLTSSIDFNQSYALVTQTELQLAQLRRSQGQALQLLQFLIGTPLPSTLPVGLPLDPDAQLTRLDPGLPSALLEARPDVRLAEHQLRAANANIGVARALYFPIIALTGAGGYASNELSGLVSDSNRVWSFGAGAVLPLLDWGARRARVDAANAGRDEREVAYQSTVQNAFREVASGLVAAEQNDLQIAAQVRAVEVQQALVVTAHDRYDVGLTPYLEVLDAERNHFAAEQNLLQLRAAALQDAVNLYAALGGGQDLRERPTD